MFQDYGYYMVGMHAFWWIFWIILVVSILFSGRGRSERRHDRGRETPHEVLRRRLANGEIKPEEYEQHKALLDQDTVPK
ncbi:SHOCT domain-containing protein [Polaromonas naphthalenivorans]|jgi:putative membrane protein|nr:SHOCT domain-containing protein [Polaromonas naphthalenivorans]MDO8264418.1 SHOCT domain-containing protein [Gallionella sp.]